MSGSSRRHLVLEADGASRGNPGPAAYGVVVSEASAVLAEEGTTIGTATNNVAEYRGLIGGLRLVGEVAPDAASVEVKMDSKLVVEQMSGRWKIKHPELQRLAAQAHELADRLDADLTYTWIPRAQNAEADRLANEALDGTRSGATVSASTSATPPAATQPSIQQQARGWSATGDVATTLILVRHGVTPLTAGKRFSGGLGGSNPGLSDEGREQIRATGDWLAPMAEQIDTVIASPVRRTHESAQILAERWDRPLTTEHAFAEMEFGHWDGLSFAEVTERHGSDLDTWLGSLEVRAGDSGESFLDVQDRVLAGLDRVLDAHQGRTVAVVSHVTPIKTLVARALHVPLESVFRMELTPASLTVMSFFGESDHRGSLRLFNAMAPGRDGWGAPSAW